MRIVWILALGLLTIGAGGQHQIEAGGTLRHFDTGAPGLRILHCSNGQSIKVLKQE